VRERFAELYNVQWALLLAPTVAVIAINVAAIGAAVGKGVVFRWSLAQVVSAACGLLFNVWILMRYGVMGRWSKRPYLLFALLVVAVAAFSPWWTRRFSH
jgi:mixed-linked glucan synthase